MKVRLKEAIALVILAILFFIASVVGAMLGRKMAEKDIQQYLMEAECLNEGRQND